MKMQSNKKKIFSVIILGLMSFIISCAKQDEPKSSNDKNPKKLSLAQETDDQDEAITQDQDKGLGGDANLPLPPVLPPPPPPASGGLGGITTPAVAGAPTTGGVPAIAAAPPPAAPVWGTGLLSDAMVALANVYYTKPYGDEHNHASSRWVAGKFIQVERPNHGIAHAVRKAAFAKDIATIFEKNKYPGNMGNWLEMNVTANPLFVRQLEFAMLMLRTGREGEDPANTHYKRYCNASAAYFIIEAPKTKLFSAAEIADFEFAMRMIGDLKALKKSPNYTVHRMYLYSFFYAAHCLDLRRLKNNNPAGHPADGSSVRDGVAGFLQLPKGSPIVTSLWDRAGKFLQATGDRDREGIYGHQGWLAYQDHFYTLSDDPVQLLQVVDAVQKTAF